MAAEVVKACKDGILMTICCYATQQLVHQGPPSESKRGGGARRGGGGGNGNEWGEVEGISFVAIVSEKMGKGVAEPGSKQEGKDCAWLAAGGRIRTRGSLILWGGGGGASGSRGSESAPPPESQWASVNLFPTSCHLQAKHTRLDSPRQKNETKCLTRRRTKAAFHKITPPPPARPSPPSLSLCRAPFRGGLILFHSLTVSLSSVNLSFGLRDYAAEYQGNTNPKKVPILCSPPPPSPRNTPLLPLPLISLLWCLGKKLRKHRGHPPPLGSDDQPQ